MSSFEVKVCKLEILPHPNADKIELAKVGDYVSVVKKGEFKTGDLGVYIPEQALVPEWILKEIGLDGKLDGPGKNRVKAHKFRGVLSQGLIYPVRGNDAKRFPYIEIPSTDAEYEKERTTYIVKLDMEVSGILGITKWEPTVPQHMKGRAVGVALNVTVNYDIENIKKHNNQIQEGELVVMTEKIHGTFMQMGYVPKRLSLPCLSLGAFTVTSKGLGGKGILLDFDDQTNVYSKIANDKNYNLAVKLPCIKAEYKDVVGDNPIYVCGEVFGPGVQTGFGYGVPGGEIAFRMFDLAYGERGNIRYFDFNLLNKISKDYDIPMVPILYIGPFFKTILEIHTKGVEKVSGKKIHMKEGTVVKPLKERYDDRHGRVILKSISEEYLLRKGDVTEYT